MTTITFDTLKYAKALRAAGFEERQAEALVEAQTEMLSDSLETTIATKADISDLKTDLAIVKWMLGILLAGVMAILLKTYFPR